MALELTHTFGAQLSGQHQARAARTRHDVLIDSPDGGEAAYPTTCETKNCGRETIKATVEPQSTPSNVNTPDRRLLGLDK